MKAVITVVGKDTVGILAKISSFCANHNVNVTDVTQTILQDMFCMIMMCDISKIDCDFGVFVDTAAVIGTQNNLRVHVMHEDIFNSMHRI